MTTATADHLETDYEPVEGDVLDTPSTSMVEALNRAEIDVQIATAHKFPRSMATFKRRAIEMATSDEETAESCIYRRPVGKKQNDRGRWETEFAEGMSVRMAEIVGACYGNIRVYATLLSQSDRQVVARGMAIDLESNFASSSEIVEATVTKEGRPFSERMRVVVAKAALAKARRDAMFQVVPRALAKPIEMAVRQVLVGDAESMEKRRSRVVGWINKLSIDPARVYASIGVAGAADLTAEHLEKLTGIKTAIKDGDVKIDEAFPQLDGNGAPAPIGSKADDLAERLKKKSAKSKAATPPPAAQQVADAQDKAAESGFAQESRGAFGGKPDAPAASSSEPTAAERKQIRWSELVQAQAEKQGMIPELAERRLLEFCANIFRAEPAQLTDEQWEDLAAKVNEGAIKPKR